MSRRSHFAAALGVAALVALIETSCRDGRPAAAAGPKRVTSHPTAENIWPAERLGARISNRVVTPDHRRAASLLDDLRTLGPAHTLGAARGEPALVFGRIEDVAFDDEGQVLILDSRLNEVRVFSKHGQFIESFGRAPNAPRLFRHPEKIAGGAGHTLIVADRGRSLKLFVSNAGRYVANGSIEVPLVPEDLCTREASVYVRGWTSSGFTLHEYRLDGTYGGSFGRGYQSPQALVREQLSDGLLACSHDSDVIVAATEYFPYVYGYSPKGQSIWISTLEAFTPMRIEDSTTEEGRPAVNFDRGSPYDRIVSLEMLSSDYVLLQSERVERHGEREIRRIDTYLLSARTGHGWFVGSQVPLIREVRWPRLYATTEEPFAQMITLAAGGTRSVTGVAP
jgi:hypothetical protein